MPGGICELFPGIERLHKSVEQKQSGATLDEARYLLGVLMRELETENSLDVKVADRIAELARQEAEEAVEGKEVSNDA